MSENGNGHVAQQKEEAHLRVLGEERRQVSELRAAASALIERIQFAQLNGLSFNGKRNLYEVLGYPRVITTRQYQEEYRRGGIGGRLVDVYPNATWRGDVTLSEDDDPVEKTPFEEAWKKLDRRLQLRAKFLRGDKLAQIAGFSILLLGAEGNPDEELPRVSGSNASEKLMYVSAFCGSTSPGGRGTMLNTLVGGQSPTYDADVSVYALDTDIRSPRFGLPVSYYLRRSELTSADTVKPIHWTRVIHVADGLLFDDVYGLPSLERVWNLLEDLHKVTGGGAEAFWLRANQGLHLNIDKDMKLPDAKDQVALLKEQAEEYQHQLTRWLRTRGVNATVLGSDVANFSSPADAVLTQIAGAKGIPKRILTGSEMGELASSQDRDNWKDQIDGRQQQYAGPYILRPFADRLIEYGYLPSPSKGADAYEVLWPHVQTMTEQERAAGAEAWATVNKTQGEIVFTNDEIRDHWYGKEPLSPDEKQPVAAPVRETANLPPGQDPDRSNPDVRAASELSDEEQELLRVLEDALECGNVDVIHEILGLPATSSTLTGRGVFARIDPEMSATGNPGLVNT